MLLILQTYQNMLIENKVTRFMYLKIDVNGRGLTSVIRLVPNSNCIKHFRMI
jgi:hypothetical protein